MPTCEKLGVSCIFLNMAQSVRRLGQISEIVKQSLDGILGCESCARTSAGNFNFWVASLVLEHQQAILILVCMHLVDVCVVLKPTSVYFLTRGLSQKHFAQVINMHLFISKINNIYFVHLSLYQAFNKIL